MFNKNLYLIYRHFISKQELYHRFVKSPGYNSPTLSLSLLKIISCNKSFHINKINNQILTKKQTILTIQQFYFKQINISGSSIICLQTNKTRLDRCRNVDKDPADTEPDVFIILYNILTPQIRVFKSTVMDVESCSASWGPESGIYG